MIDSAVTHGIRSMEEDPKRSIRRLADLGKQFSKGHFQQDVFSIIQKALENENSGYYEMMANLLRNTDHDAIKTFGVNMGYNAWTYGARKIRAKEKETGKCLPPTLYLRYKPHAVQGLTRSVMHRLISEGQALGIYSYMLRETGEPSDSCEMLDLFTEFPECAFVLLRPAGRMTAAQIQLAKLCRNLLVLLPAADPETTLTAPILRDQKILFSLYGVYSSADEVEKDNFETAMREVITLESPLFIPVAGETVSPAVVRAVAAQCAETRLDQKYPAVIMDYYGDMETLMQKMVYHDHLIELGTDGAILRPLSLAGKQFPLDQPLADTLLSIMPTIDTSVIEE